MVKQDPPPEEQHIAIGINVRAILWTGFALLGTVALVVAGAFSLHRLLPRTPARTFTPPGIAAALEVPRVQSDPQADLTQFRQDKQAMLNRYSWVSHAAGIVAIPIEQAMHLMAERSERDGR